MNYVLILFISLIVFLIIMHYMKKRAMAGNPITTISPQGTMGFIIGDKWNFVLSRMLHLQLITKDEFKKYKEEYPAYIGDWMECNYGCFVVSCHFNNIKQIEFSMKKWCANKNLYRIVSRASRNGFFEEENKTYDFQKIRTTIGKYDRLSFFHVAR